MAYLLNGVYLALLVLLSPFLLWTALRTGKYRTGYGAKLWGLAPQRAGDRPCIWWHAVSVGEVNLLEKLLAEMARRRPDCQCVVSTTTLAGYQLACTRYPQLTVFYCPLDFSWAVRRAMRRVRPALLVLAELELWPNLIRAAGEQGVRVAIINGRLSDRSFRGYGRIRPLVGRLLRQMDCVAAQNQEYADRFATLGARPSTVAITGSLKFDGAETNRRNPATTRLRALAGLTDKHEVFLAGSTQEPEESLALAAFETLRASHPQLRLILVPRHPERFEAVAQLLTESGVSYVRRSALRPGGPPADAAVLLIDVVGELGAWWGTADVAYVGGSLSQRGGQNMIEPAAYGAAVSFGPNTWNFRDIVAALLAAQAAVVVNDGAELTAFVRRALEDRPFAAQLGARAQTLVQSQLGAVERTANLLETLLPADKSSGSSSAQRSRAA